jgi:uncharacterized protein (DUF305 family)
MTRHAWIAMTWAALALPLAAQTTEEPAVDHTMMDHSTTEMSDTAAADDPASTRAFKEASVKMHSEMAITYSGNADIDFIRGMIPHHQGAVDAARIAPAYGTDPEVRKFAESVIAAQEAEIAWMTDWLARAQE